MTYISSQLKNRSQGDAAFEAIEKRSDKIVKRTKRLIQVSDSLNGRVYGHS